MSSSPGAAVKKQLELSRQKADEIRAIERKWREVGPGEGHGAMGSRSGWGMRMGEELDGILWWYIFEWSIILWYTFWLMMVEVSIQWLGGS